MTIRRISLPLLVALALAGCANADPAGAPLPASSSPVSASPASAPAGVSPSASAGEKPGGVETLSGTITAGVEPGCLLLDDHLLIVSDPKLKAAAQPGVTVTVTGRVQEGMMSTCQQGTPFLVTALRAN